MLPGCGSISDYISVACCHHYNGCLLARWISEKKFKTLKLRTKLTKTKKITRRRQWFIREEGVTKYPLSGDLKIYRIGREGAKGERTSVFFWDFLVLTLHYPGCEMVLVMTPPPPPSNQPKWSYRGMWRVKIGFLGYAQFRLFAGGWHVYFMCIHMVLSSKSL